MHGWLTKWVNRSSYLLSVSGLISYSWRGTFLETLTGRKKITSDVIILVVLFFLPEYKEEKRHRTLQYIYLTLCPLPLNPKNLLFAIFNTTGNTSRIQMETIKEVFWTISKRSGKTGGRGIWKCMGGETRVHFETSTSLV